MQKPVSWDVGKAVKMLAEGRSGTETAEAVGITVQNLYAYKSRHKEQFDIGKKPTSPHTHTHTHTHQRGGR